MSATQVSYPWRATARTVIQVVIAGAAAMPELVAAVQGNDGAALTRGAAIALAVAAAVTRVMAIPAVNEWLTLLGLGAEPKSAKALPRSASYGGPDEWVHTSQVAQGGNPSATESIADSWVATNRAVYTYIPATLGAIQGSVDAVAQSAVDKLLAVSFEFGNQDDVPVEQRGHDTIISSVNATNQHVFSPDYGLPELAKKLDELAAAVAALSKPADSH